MSYDTKKTMYQKEEKNLAVCVNAIAQYNKKTEKTLLTTEIFLLKYKVNLMQNIVNYQLVASTLEMKKQLH